MATMIPENVQAFKTEGEKAFYRFLQRVAKPDAHYMVWYCPDLADKAVETVQSAF